MAPFSDRLEESLALQVRVELTERGMTQKELADQVGISVPTMNMYLKGRRSIPIQTLAKIAGIFGVAPSVILGRAGDRINASRAAASSAKPTGGD